MKTYTPLITVTIAQPTAHVIIMIKAIIKGINTIFSPAL